MQSRAQEQKLHNDLCIYNCTSEVILITKYDILSWKQFYGCIPIRAASNRSINMEAMLKITDEGLRAFHCTERGMSAAGGGVNIGEATLCGEGPWPLITHNNYSNPVVQGVKAS